MNIKEDATVAQIVTEDYRSADVFKKYSIDFCCGGKVSLQTICSKKGLDYHILYQELNDLSQQQTEVPDFNMWELDKLAQYILDRHHSYVMQNLALITQYVEKVALVHGHHRPEVMHIRDLFTSVVAELSTHMKKEELVLFPYILQLAAAKRNGVKIALAHFGTVQNPIQMMEHEHDTAGNLMHEISELSNTFNPPEEACNTYRVLYAKLKEFEEDLHIHVHLENNILFPKAITLEKEVTR